MNLAVKFIFASNTSLYTSVFALVVMQSLTLKVFESECNVNLLACRLAACLTSVHGVIL